jgi:Cof subfamily protein (haloacid dehalogenase superfamily)
MYKLICLDMDGTLLNSKGQVSERNLEAIKKAHEKGVKVTVCTGRLFTSARFYADMLGVEVPVIASNGAYIREKDKNEIIYKSPLGFENSMRILEVLKKHDITFFYHTFDTVFMKKLGPDSAYVNINKTLPKDKQINLQAVDNWEDVFKSNSEEILKCMCSEKDVLRIAKAKEELLRYGDIEVVSSMYNNFEVMKKRVSKGRAVEILAGFYNLNREEVMCIGDNENDISMIKYAGMGVAMGNGEEYVKELADFVTDTNDNDGVAKAIEKFILS